MTILRLRLAVFTSYGVSGQTYQSVLPQVAGEGDLDPDHGQGSNSCVPRWVLQITGRA